ncbi:DMT family transporter [Fibrobacter sp.]|uniref:DMT family transporter n=1 Tax=Fibrobacter sp. TaxID=35828 RepID=UPI0038675976
MNKNFIAIIYAIAAAAFYALNVPCSKMLLAQISPVFMAGLLYIGAGLGIGILYLFHIKHEPQTERLGKKDLPYTLGMVLLDIIAPILLMFGVKYGTSSNASLLGNFEIVATTLIALFIFKERVSLRLWLAILFITISSFILSFESTNDFNFSIGSIFVLGATICWGLENNCTRRISDKSTYQIVTIKGLCSGFGSIIVSITTSEISFAAKYIPIALLLGFVAYGLSIFTYIRAQKYLGAAKTSAFYAIAPFIGVLFSFVLLDEKFTLQNAVAFLVMVVGTTFVIYDTLVRSHIT